MLLTDLIVNSVKKVFRTASLVGEMSERELRSVYRDERSAGEVQERGRSGTKVAVRWLRKSSEAPRSFELV